MYAPNQITGDDASDEEEGTLLSRALEQPIAK
jgi:hypothetical protein